MRRPATFVVPVLLLLAAACGADPTEPGEMTDQHYRSIQAMQPSDVSIQHVEDRGAVRSDELATTFESEGGSPPAPALDCLYARVLHLRTTESEQYRGTARFCFDDEGRSVSVERHRADVQGTTRTEVL